MGTYSFTAPSASRKLPLTRVEAMLLARTHLYMAATYPKRFRLSRQQQELFEDLVQDFRARFLGM